MMTKVRKGNTVIVIAGKDKGKKGEVIGTNPDDNKVVVKGLNIVKKSVKKSSERQAGGFTEIEAPIHASNVMMFCPKCNKGVRIGFVTEKNGTKVRACKKCGQKFE